MIETGYRIRCDRCKRGFNKSHRFSPFYHDVREMENDASKQGWHVDGEAHICPDCAKELIKDEQK